MGWDVGFEWFKKEEIFYKEIQCKKRKGASIFICAETFGEQNSSGEKEKIIRKKFKKISKKSEKIVKGKSKCKKGITSIF